jgi:hypothetical protein
MAITLIPPMRVRRCLRCGQLITFSWIERPVTRSRRGRVTRVAFEHPSAAACEREQAYRAPGRDDIAARRARMNDALAEAIEAAEAVG